MGIIVEDRRPFASRWDGPARRRGKAKRDRDVLRSPSYLALRNHVVLSDLEGDRRSPSPAHGRARPDRNFDGDECEDRGCCSPNDDDLHMPPHDDDFYVRIESPDRLFKCVRCHDMLSSTVYELDFLIIFPDIRVAVVVVDLQCAEGHVTCATCHGSANGAGAAGGHKCSHCGSPEYAPSRAVANWLRSVRFSCPNYQYGCPSFLPRHEMKADHEATCRYAPVFCPLRHCYFGGGPADELERHLTSRHDWDVVAFRYGEPFRVRVQPSQSLLRAEDGEIFHLCSELEPGGTALSMIRIRPENAAAAEFTYELRTPAAAGLRHGLQMQSTVWATSLWRGAEGANPVCVTVPDDMFPLEGPEQDSVEVRVHKVAAPGPPARDN
ncbi:uncharacterized protein LOC120709653 [Panicum virgatum]|uniref:uncharacterized protein LOC120709653 n=1 Tax=Panicum virgatum TaxID=38727 RepID=UPI0019D6628A|nr:uncharacterized protein LOC120709653 [Panicum virgatum]